MEEQEAEMTAQERVFAIPELLENIILHMRIDDILINAQRVKKTWHDTIQKSTRLQEALFFKPVPWNAIKCNNPPKISGYKGLTKLAKNLEEYAGSDIPEKLSKGSAVKNSLALCLRNPYWLSKEARVSVRLALGRPEASWRRMYVSQPPTQSPRSGKKPIIRLGDLKPLGMNYKFGRHEVF